MKEEDIPKKVNGTVDKVAFAQMIADDLLRRGHFITFRDTEKMYFYGKAGIYVSDGETYIRQEVQRKHNKYSTRHFKKEIVERMKCETFITRNKVSSDLELICVENGILNIRTGELMEHSPDRIFLSKLPIVYDTNVDCPAIKKFFEEIVPLSYVKVLQEFIGYCLYREYSIHKLFILVGEGANGKTTFMNLLKSFLGPENVMSIPLQQFALDQFSIGYLYQKYANICDDLSSKALSDSGPVKMLTGYSPITAQVKFSKPINFTNYAKMIFATNKPPAIYDHTDAMFRRISVITFPNRFEGEREDKQLIHKLTTPEELSGLLNYAVEGLTRLLENGGFSSDETTEETRMRYIKMSDSVQAFLYEMVVLDAQSKTLKQDLYESYVDYCRDEQLVDYSEPTFHKRLKRNLGSQIKDVRLGRKNAWAGIKLKYLDALEEDDVL